MINPNLKAVLAQTKMEARPYQERIVTKAVDMFQGRYKRGDGSLAPKHRSVLIESPTGSGKTCIALLGLKTLQREIPDLAVGWVAMRKNLLRQAARENVEKNVNVSNIHFTSMFSHSPEPLLRAKKEGRPLLLVTDECQHDAASSMTHLHNILEPQLSMGLSATPWRADRVKLCYDAIIKDAGIHQLISDGYLSRYHHYSIQSWNTEVVAETYLREPERWGKSIFYFVNLNECRHLSHIFSSHGIAHELVTGDSDVEAQLERFQNGEVKVLINCMMLCEGFDEPSLQTVFLRDSSKGPTVQMGGRVFRKFSTLPFKNIVQSKNTKWPMMRTALPAQQYIWQDGWLSLKVNEKIGIMNQNARLAIASVEVKMPKFIQDKLDKKAKKRARV